MRPVALLFACVFFTACREAPVPRARVQVPDVAEVERAARLVEAESMELTRDNFDAHSRAALSAVQARTERQIREWGLDRREWWVDQEAGTITFTDDKSAAVAPAQIIGSIDRSKGTWKWSWANDTVLPQMRAAALQLKAKGEALGIARLTTAEFAATEDDAWRLTATAVKLAGLEGVYRGPFDDSVLVFIGFGPVRITPR